MTGSRCHDASCSTTTPSRPCSRGYPRVTTSPGSPRSSTTCARRRRARHRSRRRRSPQVLARGFSTDQGDLPATAASNANGSAPQTAGLPKWRRAMVKTSKFVAGLSLAAKVALGAGFAVAATATAGVAGVLPGPVQHAVADAVGSVTPLRAPGLGRLVHRGRPGYRRGAARHSRQRRQRRAGRRGLGPAPRLRLGAPRPARRPVPATRPGTRGTGCTDRRARRRHPPPMRPQPLRRRLRDRSTSRRFPRRCRSRAR